MEIPQPSATVTVGVVIVEIMGAANPLPAGLVHPFSAWVTEYVPAVYTWMEDVVAPLLHNKGPLNDPAVNTELPQLSATDTVGADGINFGVAIPLPGGLVDPPTV